MVPPAAADAGAAAPALADGFAEALAAEGAPELALAAGLAELGAAGALLAGLAGFGAVLLAVLAGAADPPQAARINESAAVNPAMAFELPKKTTPVRVIHVHCMTTAWQAAGPR